MAYLFYFLNDLRTLLSLPSLEYTVIAFCKKMFYLAMFDSIGIVKYFKYTYDMYVAAYEAKCVVSALSRLMPNVRGPCGNKRLYSPCYFTALRHWRPLLSLTLETLVSWPRPSRGWLLGAVSLSYRVLWRDYHGRAHCPIDLLNRERYKAFLIRKEETARGDDVYAWPHRMVEDSSNGQMDPEVGGHSASCIGTNTSIIYRGGF